MNLKPSQFGDCFVIPGAGPNGSDLPCNHLFAEHSEHITLESESGLCDRSLMAITEPFRGVATGWEGQS